MQMVNYLSKQMFSLLHVLELQLLLQQIHYGLWRLGYKYCIVKLFSVSISICDIYLQRKGLSLLKILYFAFDYWRTTLSYRKSLCHWNDCQDVKYHTMCHWHVIVGWIFQLKPFCDSTEISFHEIAGGDNTTLFVIIDNKYGLHIQVGWGA